MLSPGEVGPLIMSPQFFESVQNSDQSRVFIGTFRLLPRGLTTVVVAIFIKYFLYLYLHVYRAASHLAIRSKTMPC